MRHPTHAIADIVFGPDGSSLVCQCGEDVHAPTEDELNEPYQAHRVAVGEQRRSYSSSELAAPGQPIRWREGISIDPKRAYRLRHPDKVKEAQRRYRERKKAVAA